MFNNITGNERKFSYWQENQGLFPLPLQSEIFGKLLRLKIRIFLTNFCFMFGYFKAD